DEAGRFRFDDVPEGRVSLQAADWRVSRTPAFTDLILGAGDTAEVDLTLPEGSTRTVTGTVHFDDPISGSLIPLEGVVAFIAGPGNFAYTGADGRYRIEGVPVQGVSDHQYQLTVIDSERHQQEMVTLPPILDSSPELIYAQNVVPTGGIWEGGADGVVLDPLGRPMAGVEVVLFPFAEMTTLADGSFSFDDIPVGDYTLTAHIGNGLQPGY
ncbi:MAG: carboxypeptidase regulatory-like domain-containing protein, partial [bacterium]|nr:carboxypeptidase regulatory-like domain-containing protein [bacterium]